MIGPLYMWPLAPRSYAEARIAEALNRTTFAVRRRASTLGLPLVKIARLRQPDSIRRRLVEIGLKAKT
jgi:hypothetical protein